MKRTQIQLEESTFAKLRELAYRRNVPIAQLIREAIDATYGVASPGMRANQLGFVGRGRSSQPSVGAVSEEHDAELDQAYRT